MQQSPDMGITVLRELLKFGRLRGRIRINVAEGVPLLYKGGDRAEIIWTPEDIEAFKVAAIEAKLGVRPQHLSYPVGDPTSAGPREFRIAAELGFKTAVTTRPGVLFKAHRSHLVALPRFSINGEIQQQRYLEVLMSGAATAIRNHLRRVDAA